MTVVDKAARIGECPVFTGPELCALDAVEVVTMLRKGDVSPQELLDTVETRLNEVEPHVNATPTRSIERARQMSQRLSDSEKDHPGWLGGLPIGIKDLTTVKGVRTTFGTRALADFVPNESDPLVELLEARGGLVAGKTNTPEFGAGGNTFNDVFGATLNPWNTELNAGGSSGGAAASLATGEFWLSLGSDHGGSLRTPAAYCGIVGLRPSPGMCGGGSTDNGFMTEGVDGPMARSVMDCALFMDAMSGYDPRFPISYPAPTLSYQEAVRRAEPNLRITFAPDLNGFCPVDTEVSEHLSGVMKQLEKSGVVVEQTCPDITHLERTYHVLRGIMWATLARQLPENVMRHFKPTLAENVAFGQRLTIDDVTSAHVHRSQLYNRMLALFENFDVLALPVTGCMPHPQSEEWVRRINGVELGGYMDWLRFAFLATVTGLPAISVPVGPGPRGLPIGIQLIGKPRGEAALLAAARVVEMVIGCQKTPIDPIRA